MNEFEILDRLHEAGVEFVVRVPDRGRVMRVAASPYDLIEFAADNDRYYAKCHRVAKEAYLGWVADNFSVKCGYVENGVPCEDVVPGGESVTARKYVAMQGRMCAHHRKSSETL